MVRNVFAAALSVVTIIFVGLVALNYKANELGNANLNNSSLEAYNFTLEVSTGVGEVVGNAMPMLVMVLVVVFALMMLLTLAG